MTKQIVALLVEDEDAHVELIRRGCEAAGIEVSIVEAHTVAEACRALDAQQQPPEVIVADWLLPDGKGLDLIAQGNIRKIPVIIMTSHGNEAVAVEAVQAGAMDYLVKSDITLLDMSHTIERAVREWRTRTEREKIARRLQESEAQVRTALSSVPAMLLAVDENGTITIAEGDGLRVAGLRSDVLVGHKASEVLAQVLPLAERLHGAMEGRAGSDTVSIGESFFDTWFSPVVGENGRALGAVGVAIDVTAQKIAEQEKETLQAQLAQSQKIESIGRLAGGVAHDFNNLLTVISVNVELALEELRVEDPLRPVIEEIGQAAESAATLTRQLLAFSRRQIISPTVLDLNGLILNMQRMMERLLGEDITLKLSLREGLTSVRADRGQMEQALVNLVVNARDAMPGGGVISVCTDERDLDEEYCQMRPDARPGPHVTLSVSDTGVGISAEARGRLFEPFFTTKAQGRGTGLGLATTYGAVRQNEGSIEVESEPGHGTTFRILLPSFQGEASPPPVSAPSVDARQRGTETVVFVEDEDFVREMVSRSLRKLGYTVLAHANGGEALLALRKHPGPVHLLLTDMVMPGMSGRALAEEVAAHWPGIRVLFTSGYSQEIITADGGLAPGINFISKPYTMQTLSRKVREVLDGQESS